MVFTTLIALVPVLGIAIALLRGFGIDNLIEPWLTQLFAPMGSAGGEVVSYLLDFVKKINASSLGTVGIIFLLFTVINLIQKVELALNYIWRVRKRRPFAARITTYLSVILLLPILIATLMGAMVDIQRYAEVSPYSHYESFSLLTRMVKRLFPLFFSYLFLTLIYLCIPYRRVEWRSALAGSTFFFLLFPPISAIFKTFFVGTTKYSIIYSSFTCVILLLFWLYVLWLLFLFGAKIGSWIQFPQTFFRDSRSLANKDGYFFPALALLRIMQERFSDKGESLKLEEIQKHRALSPDEWEALLQRLEAVNLIQRTEKKRFIIAQDIDSLYLDEIWSLLFAPPSDTGLCKVNHTITTALHQRFADWRKE